MKHLLTAIALLLLSFTLSAQQIAKGLTAANGTYIGFYEYKPTEYATSPDVKYPVIIFLHGIGERGNGTTELSRVLTNAIPKYINAGHKMRFYWNGKWETFLVLSPQLGPYEGYWPSYYVEEMVSYAKNNLRIDTNRIIVTGLSLGGGGTWQYASTSAANSKALAALAPVCGTCTMVNACNISKANLPVWAFHAIDDGVVGAGCTTSQVSSVSTCGTAIEPLMTIYSNGNHYIWDRAYDTVYNWQNPNIYEWFLAQNKSLAPNVLPIANAGANLTISTSKASVNLSGVLSSDADGSIVRYIWTKLSGPATGTIATPVSTTGLTAVTNLTTAGTYVFQLKVVDDRASTATATVTVTVTTGVVANIPPVAEAGNDISISTTSTNLNGSASYDPDGVITAYKWTKLSGPASYTLSSTTVATPSVSGLVTGKYSFELEATDNAGASKKDTVEVTASALNLPVKWLYFKGRNNNGHNDLQWATSGQLNTQKFEVEKSIDGVNYIKIGEVAGAGTTNVNQYYNFTDNTTVAEKSFYRIREKSIDGDDSFSEVVTIRVNNGNNTLFEYYPNPVRQQLTIGIQCKESGAVTLSIFSVEGKQVLQQHLIKENEFIQAVVDMKGLQPGIYMLQYSIGNKMKEIRKIIKQ